MTAPIIHAPAYGIALQRQQLSRRVADTASALRQARQQRDDARQRAREAEQRATDHWHRWQAATAERDQLRREADTLHRMHGHAAVIAEHIHITAHDGTALVPADDLQQLLSAVGVIRNLTGGME